MNRRLLALLLVLFSVITFGLLRSYHPNIAAKILPNLRSTNGAERIAEVTRRVKPRLQKEFQQKGLKLGAPLYLRAFKKEMQMELWVENSETNKFELFRTYKIAAASGDLGPKLAEGDGQTPEGFYSLREPNLHPGSLYHLAINIGFPNKFDRANGRTGSFIMIHGSSASIGCFAMTDPKIEEIYLSLVAAFEKGQSAIPFHSFPYRMSEKISNDTPHAAFWGQLKPAYDIFEKTRQVPNVQVSGKRYKVSSN